ncbi:MAG: tetratricopeptide repeat protein [Saprospiraceae bacterium]
MKKIFFLFYFIWTLPFSSIAETKVDSLIQKAAVSVGEEKAKVCLTLIDALKFSNQKKAKEYGQEGLAIAKKLELKKLESRFLLNLGIVNAIQANYSESIVYYKAALNLFIKAEDAKGIGQSHSNIGLTQEKLGNYDEAMASYEKAMVLFQTLEDSNTVMLIKGNIANLDFKKGDYDAALLVYKEVLEWAVQNKSQKSIALYYGNIGRVFSKKGNYPASLNCYYKALPIMDSLDNRSGMLNLYNNIGLLFSNLEMDEFAIENFEKGLMLYDSMGNKFHVGAIHNNLSKLYIRKKDFDKAYIHIQKALSIYDTIGLKTKGNLLQHLAAIYIERMKTDSAVILLDEAVTISLKLKQEDVLASAYASFGQLYFKQKDLVKAKDYLLKAETIYDKLGEVKGLSSTAETLAKIYESEEDLEMALSYKARNALLRDSLFGLEKMNKIIRLEMERKRLEYLRLKPEAIQTTNTSSPALPWIIFLLIGGIGSGIYLWIQKRKETKLHNTINHVAAENESIKESLSQQSLEMTFLSLDMIQKDDFLKKIKTELEKFAKKVPDNKEVQELIRSVHFQDVEKKDWENFKNAYEQVFPLFFDTLLQNYPTLSNKELRHCALIRLKIPLQEVADILGISINSVHKARHRLRTKFQITRSDKLESFILKY